MNWEDKPQVKKGNIGENIIIDFLEKKGYIIYKPITKAAHWIDIIATKNKEEIYAIDVKTKARFNKWMAQGIDVKHYEDYKRFKKKCNINVYLFFVDDKNGEIHCADLNKLSDGFCPNNPEIIAWNLDEMELVDKLPKNQIKILSKYDTRNYEFNPTQL